MASNAERQASYRERHLESGGGRINFAVTAHAEAGLRRLAAHQGLTRRALLERLISEAESMVLAQLAHEDQKLYCAGAPVTA